MLPTSRRCLSPCGPSLPAAPLGPTGDAVPCVRRGTARPAPERRRRRQREGTRSLRQGLRPELFPCGGSFNGRVPACFLDGLRSPKGRGRGPGAGTGGLGAGPGPPLRRSPSRGRAGPDVNRPPSRSTCCRALRGCPRPTAPGDRQPRLPGPHYSSPSPSPLRCFIRAVNT